jgi:hypothetical protein
MCAIHQGLAKSGYVDFVCRLYISGRIRMDIDNSRLPGT